MKTKMSRLLHRFACCNERGGAAVTAAIPSTMSTHGENANARGCRKRFVCFGIGRSHSLTTLQVPVSQGSFNKRRTRAPSNSSGNPLHALEEKLQRVTASSEAWRREYELRCQVQFVLFLSYRTSTSPMVLAKIPRGEFLECKTLSYNAAFYQRSFLFLTCPVFCRVEEPGTSCLPLNADA